MRILITGGAGFIGSHLTETFAEAHDVLVIDNFATARRDSLSDAGGVTLVEGSIGDRSLVEDTFAGFEPEVVLHCAASYKDPDDWEEDVLTNALGTTNVVQAAVRAGTRRLVYFQTALCYGNRPQEQPVTLSHPLRPESSYAVSKTAGEQYIALSGLDFVSLRLANVYGPRNVSGPIPTFYSRLAAGKSCFSVNTRRDFVFVDDLVRAVVKVVQGAGHGVYHVSTGRDYAIKELYDAVAGAMGTDQPVEERERGADDSETILLDPSRTHADLDWEASVPLEEGIRRTVDWYRAHGVEETYTHLRMKE